MPRGQEWLGEGGRKGGLVGLHGISEKTEELKTLKSDQKAAEADLAEKRPSPRPKSGNKFYII